MTKSVCESALNTQALRNKTQLRLDSMTGVNPKHTHGLGIWGNPREVFSVRCDKGLIKQFNLASQALFGSTCNPIECFMASIVGQYQNATKLGVNPSNTVNIGEIKIERNLRERRKLTRTHTEVDTVESETVVSCGYRDCENEAIAKGVFQGSREFMLCADHLAAARADRKNWENIQVF